MTTIAVTGASGPVGRAFLERLDNDPAVTRIIGLDVDEPPMPVAKLEFRTIDVRDRLLPVAMAGADVVVHLGVSTAPQRDEDTLFARNVHGTRNVLAAAAQAHASKLVHLSGAGAYGAHPDNPLPLDEGAPLRANPDYAPGYHQLLAEELVADFDRTHPETSVVVLRPAHLVGPGVDHWLARLVEAPRLLGVRGCEPPLQLLHVDDLAAALHLAVTGELRGAYNVAADGWLALREACGLIHKPLFELPEASAFTMGRWLWAHGLASLPPGVLHHLEHPTVLSTARLRACGWEPMRSNREALRELAAEHHPFWRVGPARVRRRDVALAVSGVLTGLLAALALVWRRYGRPWASSGRRLARAHSS